MLEFNKLDKEQAEALDNIQKRYLKSRKKKKVAPTDLKVGIERVGNFTICAIKSSKQIYTGSAIINNKDIRGAREKSIRLEQKTGNMHAFSRAVKNLLNLPQSTGLKTTKIKLEAKNDSDSK